MVEVQVLIRKGLQRFDIIGLPQNMIREGKDRIYAALSGLDIKLPTEKILVNLNPGDIPKEGSHFDLPIIAGILKCIGHLVTDSQPAFYWGEVQLDGQIRPVEELLPHLLFANAQFRSCSGLVANFELSESVASYLNTIFMRAKKITDILELTDEGPHSSSPSDSELQKRSHQSWLNQSCNHSLWQQLKGSKAQHLVWCLAVLGKQNVLMAGPPGCGKSSWCLATREIQAPLNKDQWLEKLRLHQGQSRIRSIPDLIQAPFESPHHSASKEAILGGGSKGIQMGSITRAHNCILFLDEFLEFKRDVLESLREPLESKTITIARQGQILQLPAKISLFAAMNPCPCANFRSKKRCDCSPTQLISYQRKISEALKDRFHWKLFWEYVDKKKEASMSIRQIREQMLSALSQPKPKLGHVYIPRNLSPRKQKLWLQKLTTWAKWHHISEVSAADVRCFNDFCAEIEDGDPLDDEITRNRF